MPEWLKYLISNTVYVYRLAIKNFSVIKQAGILLNKFRNGILKDYGSDYDISIDDDGKKKTKFEVFLEGRKGLNSFLTGISKGFRKFIDVVTSPVASRVLFYAGSAFGIALAASNPIGLGLVIAGTTISVGSVMYGMYQDVNKFRGLKKLKQEQAMLEEMMTLKMQSKALAEKLFKDKPDLAEKLGLTHSLMKPIKMTDAEWEAINKKRLVGTTILESAPSATIPLVSSLVLGNIPGFFVTLSGYILELCGSTARGISYAKEKEKLMNGSIALANNLGIAGMGFGERNENLREGLAEMRAKNAALIALAKQTNNDPKTLESEFAKLYAEQKKNIEALKPDLQEKSWWHDARKIWYKDGTSYASTAKNFTPGINEYKDDFKTDKTTYKPTTTAAEIALEQPLIKRAKNPHISKHRWNNKLTPKEHTFVEREIGKNQEKSGRPPHTPMGG